MKTARRAGIKTKDPASKRSKYAIPTPPMARRMFGSASNSDTLTSNSIGDPQLAMFDDDLSGKCFQIQLRLRLEAHWPNLVKKNVQ